MPPLHQRKEDPLVTSNKDKARILVEKLILASTQVNLSNTTTTSNLIALLDILLEVSLDLIEHYIKHLPNSKATGPNSIPNEVLKLLTSPNTLADLVEAVTLLLSIGPTLKSFNESTIAILYKDKCNNYSLLGSYRPIMLENLLAKLVKKIVVDYIASATKEYNLLP
jgi:hypothetical protein